MNPPQKSANSALQTALAIWRVATRALRSGWDAVSRWLRVSRPRRALALGALLALGAVGVGRGFLGDSSYCRPVLLRNAEQTCEAVGSIGARESDAVFCPVQGDSAKILRLVEEGTIVSAGEILGELDSYATRDKLSKALTDLGNLRNELESFRVRTKLDVEKAARRQEDLARDLTSATEDLRSWDEIEAPLREFQLEGAEARFRSDVEDKAQRLKDIETFFEKGYASSVELDRAKRDLAVSKSSLEETQRQFRLFTESQRKKESDLRASRIMHDKADIVEVQQSREADERLASAKIATLEAQVGDLEQKVVELTGQVDACTIRAKRSGIVVYALTRDKEKGNLRTVRVGDAVWPNELIMSVTDLRRVDLVVQIPEAQMHDIQVGLKGTVWLTAEPLKALAGVVRTVGTVSGGSDGAGGFQRSLQVRIGLEDVPTWIRPGMTGKTRIEVGRFERALVVPFTSVVFSDERAYVFVRKFFWRKKCAIKVGGLVEEGVVVKDGISRFDLVLREAPLQ